MTKFIQCENTRGQKLVLKIKILMRKKKIIIKQVEIKMYIFIFKQIQFYINFLILF